MSDNIDTTVNANGAAIFARNPAWHNLGTVLTDRDYFDIADVLAVPGIDFTVEKRALTTPNGKGSNLITLKDFVATVRTDTDSVLGVVGAKYTVVQNREGLASLNAALQKYGAKYVTAGCLDGGRRFWVLAKLPDEWKVTEAAGDSLEEYALFVTSHDGSCGIWVLPTLVRVVCANTLAEAVGYRFADAKAKLKAGRAIKVRHRGNWQERLADADKVLAYAHEQARLAHENAQRLVEIPATDGLLQRVIELSQETFGPRPRVVGVDHAAAGKVLLATLTGEQQDFDKKQRDAIGAAVLQNVLAEYNLVGKNAWALYNGASEYADHQLRYRGKDAAENRFDSILTGRADQFKNELVQLVSKVA